MKNSVLLFSIFITLFSCTKSETLDPVYDNGIPPFIKSSSINYDGNINIVANDYTFSSIHPVNITIRGYFKNLESLIGLDELTVHNITIPYDDLETPQYNLHLNGLDQGNENYTNLVSKMGDSVLLEIEGNLNYPSFSENIQLPELINIEGFTAREISKDSSLTINWTPSLKGDQVSIILLYQTNRSTRKDPNLPNQEISLIRYATDALGGVTLMPTELTQFPTGGIVTLFIGRATQTVIAVEGKKTLINALSYQMSDDFIFIE